MQGNAAPRRSFRLDADGPGVPSRGQLYGAGESLCRTGPDGVIERLYAGPAIGVVHSEPFTYRSQTGEALAVPGTILFGNAGEHFTCRQGERGANHRSVVAFAPELFEAAAHNMGRRAGFPVVALPPGPKSAPLHAAILRLASSDAVHDELLLSLLACALAVGRDDTSPPPTARDTSRVIEVVRYLEANFAEPHSLGDLAARANLSRFHFLRLFREITGTSPKSFLIGVRLRTAAERLQGERAPVTEIALDAGFNDISHFNHLFRRAFAMSPGQWRRLGR